MWFIFLSACCSCHKQRGLEYKQRAGRQEGGRDGGAFE